MGLNQLSIGTKLTLTAVIAAAVAILCVVIAFAIQDLRLVNRIKDEQSLTHNNLLAQNLGLLLAERNTELLDLLLATSANDHAIISAAVMGKDGEVLASYQLPSQFRHQPLSPASLQQYVDSVPLGFPSRVYSTDIVWQGKFQGTLLTLVSRADVSKRVGFMAGYSLMAVVLALLLASLVSWLVQRMVSNPIHRLHELSRQVTETGNYTLRAEVSGNDELAELAQAVNLMLEQIDLRDRNLEKQVRRRTRELEDLAEAFRYRSLHDTLTGLPNRALLHEEFARAVAHADRAGKYFAVLLLDLDNFKYVNDSFGHEFGDELLKEVARHLLSVVRGEDRVCRLGGDEFVVMMEDISSEIDVHVIGENLLRDLYNEIVVLNKKVRVSVSIGASIYPRHGVELEELKRKADIAMYQAKEAGKNRLMVFEDAMGQRALHRLLVQTDLGAAIKNKSLELNFQPQIDLETRRLIGVEALVRWQHPEYGLLYPKDFIDFAEDHGLIRQLDYLVIRAACAQSRAWQDELGLRIPVSVNLSALHFNDLDIVTEIQQALAESQLTPDCLTLEVTDGLLAGDLTIISGHLEAIRALGVRLALDNFGVGGASLQFMRRFPIDVVKLDKSFSRFIHLSEREKKLAKGIISLARDYNVMLVAEGVENEDQASVLSTLGCNIMQGHWYTKPCGRQAFERWLAGSGFNRAA